MRNEFIKDTWQSANGTPLEVAFAANGTAFDGSLGFTASVIADGWDATNHILEVDKASVGIITQSGKVTVGTEVLSYSGVSASGTDDNVYLLNVKRNLPGTTVYTVDAGTATFDGLSVVQEAGKLDAREGVKIYNTDSSNSVFVAFSPNPLITEGLEVPAGESLTLPINSNVDLWLIAATANVDVYIVEYR